MTTITLSEALLLSEPGGDIRTFLDYGKPMESLLKQLIEINPKNSYGITLLKAFEAEQARPESVGSVRQNVEIKGSTVNEINLTNRDVNLLKLVAEGYQNKEIAEKLFLSPESIKKYLYNIYQKLEVKNRVDAVAKARKLDLISSSNPGK